MTPTNDTALNEGTTPPDREGSNVQKVKQTHVRPRAKHRIIMLVLLGLMLAVVVVPAGIAVGFGVNAYATYTALENEARSGMQHLLSFKMLYTGIKEHPSEIFNAKTLQQTQQSLADASKNFQQVQFTLDHSSIVHTATSYFPQYRQQVVAARLATEIGVDMINIGQTLATTAGELAPSLRAPLLATTSKPLVTASMIGLIQTTLDAILPPLNDIQAKASTLDLNALPINVAQREQFAQLVQLLPQVAAGVQQARALSSAVMWLLGVNAPRTFLVQTLDTGELRATGGFTGQYGELQIQGGRVESFFLRDISLIEYAPNSPTLGQLPPQQYRSWWPFANWGLRDSNLSADFPTSAQVAMSLYQQEVGRQVDGVIAFTPAPIEQVLQELGPIVVPGYNDTITAQNLEARLHYYQEDPSGIQKQIQVQPGDTSTSARKRFTALLAQLLIDRLHQAAPDQLLNIARKFLIDLKTRDIQLYFTNSQVEDLLAHYSDAGQIDRSTAHDGLLVVQDNLSANKSSTYVQTLLQDTVTLDAAGGATHVLHMQLVYQPTGPVYGYKTYFDYVRVYVPPASTLLSGDGFDSGTPLCGGVYYQPCSQQGVYPQQELVCPTGQYNVGPAPPSPLDPDGATWLPFDTIGSPTNLVSDEPGRAMFGGWVIVPVNCTMNVTLSWYVPPAGSGQYALLFQSQAGVIAQLDMTILPAPNACRLPAEAGLHSEMALNQDIMFTLKSVRSSARAGGCYLQLPTAQ